MAASGDLTVLIRAWKDGDEGALAALTPYVYDELKRLARRQMQREDPRHTLQATALVNEAFIKLAGAEVSYADRAHFFNTAASMMRRLLVDHARSKQRVRRGGKARDLTFEDGEVAAQQSSPAILELDVALDKLAKVEPKLAQSVELIFFGGLTYVEAAEQMGVSRTVFYEDLQFAKAWLKKELA